MHKVYQEKYNFILVGHYHQIGIYDINNLKIIFMGDWLNKFTVTTYNGQDWCQESWNE